MGDMSVMHFPDHLLTLEEWDALPEDTSRQFELAEGVLIVAPRPAPMHQRAGQRLAALLDEQLPDRLTALKNVDVLVNAATPPTVRAPDVVVTTNAVAERNPARINASDVLLAVEIMSPGSRRQDRVQKPVEYAEAGILYYWLIDLEPTASLIEYVLVDDNHYEINDKVTEAATLFEPAPVTIDVRTLTARR
jgi:Uma2 family endonuclease